MKSGIAPTEEQCAIQRWRLTVTGTVQGVGFRPFVYRLAREIELSGWVENNPQGVSIEVEGSSDRLKLFLTRLQSDKPRLANFTRVEQHAIEPKGPSAFEIRRSNGAGARSAIVLPDIGTCPECLRECLDPRQRRYRYPFTNCTHCGPRYSIIESLPYDRRNTSMKRFDMCDDCRREYENPNDRRFHAQPIACPVCGPQLQLWSPKGKRLAHRDEALKQAAAAIRSGRIVALKGLGGFQLLVDARNEQVVQSLRRRKHREDKPLALMVGTPADASDLCEINDGERHLLNSCEAPIVILRRRRDPAPSVAPSVAPANPYLGLMLPCTPLHHLLMREIGSPIVATSGNLSDEPICIDEREALERLEGVADLFLVHDRSIVRHVDDSVLRMVAGRALILRRARGFAPLPIPISDDPVSVLAVGAHQKNTVALAHRSGVFVSQHIGDLDTQQSFAAFKRAATDLPTFYEATLGAIAHDAHPDYLSTRFAQSGRAECFAVQHHHAHVVSCMMDNGLDGEVLGVSWDGTGMGTDGTIWGGEFLRSTRSDFNRFAHLRPFPLPGGECAAMEPRRSALGLLYAARLDDAFYLTGLSSLGAFEKSERNVLRQMLKKGRNCPQTSSAGRLFDAIASILGLRQVVRHEGQAAMELEFAAEEHPTNEAYPFRIMQSRQANGPRFLDWQPMLERIIEDVRGGQLDSKIAREFHNTLAEMIVAVARISGQKRIVLAGGCFQNRVLTETSIARLADAGFTPYWHRHVPPNDGGIALGQAGVARQRIKERRPCA